GFTDFPRPRDPLGALRYADRPFEENALAARLHIALARRTGDASYRAVAERILAFLSPMAGRYGVEGATFATAVEEFFELRRRRSRSSSSSAAGDPVADDALRAELIERFQDAGTPLADDAFDALARRVFARNYEAVPAYAAYCRARGRTPDTIDRWTGIPAVPTAAFREMTLLAGGMRAERVFRTSGTTHGPERRGEHHVADLDLYRASLRSTFSAFVLPDRARLRFLSLMPPADSLPDSSLAFMITDVMDAFGAEGTAAFADAD
ncbi:MAG: hypothetical protein GWN71_16105, partial [Gammaproteobacteria bacterium]|nr:hypothetical protein [Gammaproteobacteria bacterium]